MPVAQASRFARRARSRRSARVPNRAQRRALSPRPARGAELLYRKVLRRLAREFAAVVNDVLADVLHHVAAPPVPEWARADAVGASELRRRLTGAIASRLDFAHLEHVVGDVATRTDRKALAELRRLFPRLSLKSQVPGGTDTGIVIAWRRENVQAITSLFGRQTERLELLLENNEFLRVEDLSERIQQVLGVTEAKADLLARDQSMKLTAQVTQAKQRAAGIEKFVWTTVGDERVRESHEELDGQTFSWDDLPTVDGEPGVAPGTQYGCRCTPYPVVTLLDDPDLD